MPPVPPVLPVLKMFEALLFCAPDVPKTDDGVVPVLEAVFALPPKSVLPPLGVPVPEVVLFGAEPKRPAELGAEEVVLFPRPPKLHDEPAVVVGVLEPNPPPVPLALPKSVGADVVGALPDEDVGGGVPALLGFPLPKMLEGLFPAAPKGFGVLPPLPVFPNKLPPPPPPALLLVGAPNGLDPPPDVPPNSPLPPPLPDVAVFPNKLVPPDVVAGAVENKLLLCPPLEPCWPNLNVLAIVSARLGALIARGSCSSFSTRLFANSQSLFACCSASCSEGAWISCV